MTSARPAIPVVRPRAAFTIVELLVAMGITILMVAMVLQITTNVLKVWTKTTGTLETENQAALIMDLLTSDLRGAAMKRDGRVWMAATIQNDQAGTGDAKIDSGSDGPKSGWDATNGGIMKPGKASPNTFPSSLVVPAYSPPTSATQVLSAANLPSLTNLPAPSPSTYRFGQAGVWLRLFSAQPDTNTSDPSQASVPRAIGYQIVRMQLTSTGGFHYYLFRSTVRPGVTATSSPALTTFGAGYDFFTVFNSGTHSATTATYNVGSGTQDDPGNIRRPNLQQLLGNNVIDFGVRFWGRAYDSTGKELSVLLFPVSSTNLGFAATTEDGFTRTRDLNGKTVTAIVPPTTSGWTGGPANMTYGFAYKKGGGAGAPDTPCTPVVAEIFLRILDEEGARLINAMENPPPGAAQPSPPNGQTPADYWWQTAEAHSQVFTRRVELFASPM